MRTIIHADNIDGISDWLNKLPRIDEDTVYQFNLKNGFKPQLKQEGNKFVDFRNNKYVVDYRDGSLVIYKKQSDSKLEKLSDVKKIMVEE